MTSKLTQMQARFQQKQMLEKEEKLLRLYENQQQRAFERVGRSSAGSNASTGSLGSTGGGGGGGGGKVRQMFDERRQKAGVDRSYPLEPLRGQNGTRSTSTDRKVSTKTTVRSSVQKSVSHIQNGKPLASRREAIQAVYNNNNGAESYEERRYADDNSEYLFKDDPHKNLVDMMNNHNLDGGLDDEEMPRIGFDDVDEPFFTGKLANLGGKLPSQKMLEEKAPVKAHSSPAARKEVNGVVRRETGLNNSRRKEPVLTTAKKTTTPAPKPAVSKSPSPRNSASPSNTGSLNKSPMQSAKSKTASPATKAPLSGRPSARQSPRAAVARDDLAECRLCGRRFAADRVAVHEDICAKTGRKKRKVYDATKHRVTGTELESYVMRAGGGGTAKGGRNAGGRITSRNHVSREVSNIKSTGKVGGGGGQSASKKDWRRTHEEFIAAIRAAKQAQAHVARGGRLSDLPPPPPSSNPDYVQCPHCGRRFNEAAAERHIPKCANFQFNKPKGGPAPIASKGSRTTGKR